ncbi:hypothetical protein AB0J86_27850 [Micromonospora sp. NPDC049559]|uniref:hypothetical protein n=1 Tax=Micromonospora sp. NPDC049559 TaxID=3155923 RepID=UPI0034344EAE
MCSRVILAFAIAAVVLGAALLVPAAYSQFVAGTGTARDGSGGVPAGPVEALLVPPAPPTLTAGRVSVSFEGSFLSWALLERRSGRLSGPGNLSSTNSTESMLKVWLVSDYLRRLGDREPSRQRLDQAESAIVDSNDDSANALWRAGGGGAVLDRLIDICGLTETGPGTVPGYIGWWSFTTMSPRDAVRMGDCVASGRAAGRRWTPWVLETMGKVRGTVDEQRARSGGGRWGIVDGLPRSIAARVSIKNGWTSLNYDRNWHVNCLALADDWVLAVMMRYPAARGLRYGARVCASVATQLVTPGPGAALRVPKR